MSRQTAVKPKPTTKPKPWLPPKRPGAHHTKRPLPFVPDMAVVPDEERDSSWFHKREDPRPHVLLFADVPGWAFDANGRAMERYLPELHFEHAYVVEPSKWPPRGKFDAFFLPYHRWHRVTKFVPAAKALGSLRSEWFFPEVKEPPGEREAALVNRFRAFYVNNQHVYDALQPHCPHLFHLTNPVDTQMFDGQGADPHAEGVVACWSGNANHGADVKGYKSVVVPSCERAGVPLYVAEYHTSRLPHAEMPAFFRRSNVALCASSYEGASNSVMEAMACGLAVISTNVGNVGEMRASQMAHFGESGILLAERDPEAFALALMRLRREPERVRRMGEINRADVQARWSWHAWRDRYAKFFLDGLSRESHGGEDADGRTDVSGVPRHADRR